MYSVRTVPHRSRAASVPAYANGGLEGHGPSEDAIRARAYERYVRRRESGLSGDPLGDWLSAERELREQAVRRSSAYGHSDGGESPIGATSVDHVLIIESNVRRAERLVALCRGMGLKVRLSPDPLHGLMCAVNDLPAAILVQAVDAKLGPRSVAERIRRHERLASIPIVVVAEQLNHRSVRWLPRTDTMVGCHRQEVESHLRQALQDWALDAREEAIGERA